MKRILLLGLLGLVALLAVMVVRAGTFASKQVRTEAPAPVEFDLTVAVERFAGALRFRTLSDLDPEVVDWEPFRDLDRYLVEQFPLVHENLRRETIGGHSLLYTWAGTDPALKPGLLLSHLDVVPVEPGTEDNWTHPPFGGVVADGFVWGRGAMDDKMGVLAILEATELLLADGFQPRRSFLFAFGHDEEVGGPNGATVVASTLAARGIEAEFVLDEGGSVVYGSVPGVDEHVALVGIAEKGYVSLALEVEVEGGHSSTPPEQTAVGLVSAAVARLESRQMPMSLRGPVRQTLDYLGPEMPFTHRLVVANLWLFRPVIERVASGVPALAATMRTTTAATMIEGGVKENVLPSSARAVLNFRILPGESVQDVMDHVRRGVADDRVRVEVIGVGREPTTESPLDVEGFALLQRTIGQVFPEAVVAPYLVLGGTDSRHYSDLTRNIYRFAPIVAGPTDLPRIHGTDERMSVENYGQAVEFFVGLLRNG
jgi:carboxypeptidase PM20D1